MGERLTEVGLAALVPAEGDRGARELGTRRDEEEVPEARLVHHLVQVDPVEKVVGGGAVRPFTEPGRRIRLRVEVHDESALAGLGQTRREVDRGRRLSDAALLIRDRVDASGHALESSVGLGRRPRGYASGRFRAIPGRLGNRSGVGPSFANRSSVRPGRPASSTTSGGAAPSAAATRSRPGTGRDAYRISVPPGRDERETPLGCNGLRRQRAGEHDRVRISTACAGVLLGARADHLDVRKARRGRRQKRAFAARRLEQVEPQARKACGKRQPRRAPARANIDHGARVHVRERDERLVDQHPPCFLGTLQAVMPGVAIADSTQRSNRGSRSTGQAGRTMT